MRVPSLSLLTSFLRPHCRPQPPHLRPHSPSLTTAPLRSSLLAATTRSFTSTSPQHTTLNQVRRGARVPQRARHAVSPQLRNRPQMKAVCLKVGVTKPKKPNSGERKTARVKLSNGKAVTCYIQGEGMRILSYWGCGGEGGYEGVGYGG